MNDSSLESALSDWRTWGVMQAPKVLQQFAEGKNHQCFLVNCGSENFVLKLFSKPMPAPIATQNWAAQRSLAPSIIYAPTNYAYMVMQKSDASSHLDPALLGNVLLDLHTQDSSEIVDALGNFALFEYCDKYLSYCDEKINQLHRKLMPALQVFDSDQTTRVLCHNDLVSENCFIRTKQRHLIDWEFAQINNPWFDLASIILYFKLNPLQQAQFLETYRAGHAAQAGTPIYSAAICAVLWLDILWHLANGGAVAAEQQKLETLKNQAALIESYL